MLLCKGLLGHHDNLKVHKAVSIQAKPVEEFQSVGRRASNDIGYSQDKKSNHWFRWKKKSRMRL